jgi:hypothetical protein
MGTDRDSFKFGGFSSPNYTPTPDQLFDELLAPNLLSESELRVLLYIMRRTFGFKKNSDAISISQITDGIVKENGERLDWGAGVSKASAVRGIKGLEAKGIIIAHRTTSKERGHEPTTFALRMREPLSKAETSAADPMSQVDTRVPEGLFKADTRGPETLFNPDTSPDLTPESGGNQAAPMSQTDTRVGTRVKQALVSGLNTQETVKQETVQQEDDSKQIARRKKVEGVPEGQANLTFSPYISAVVTDFSDELGDASHAISNVTQALRLWGLSALGEQEFSELMFEARRRVRTYQGKQGAGTIDKRMAYFFTVLRDLCVKRGE